MAKERARGVLRSICEVSITVRAPSRPCPLRSLQKTNVYRGCLLQTHALERLNLDRSEVEKRDNTVSV